MKPIYVLCGTLLISFFSFSKVKKQENVYFIDKFVIPAASMEEFSQRMNYNRNFIKTIDGFIEDKIFVEKNENGFTLITIATWKSKEYLADAKTKVQAEYKKINFDPAEFCRRLNIKMERGIYSAYAEFSNFIAN